MSKKIACHCCGKQCVSHLSISCVICGRDFAGACVEMNATEIRTIKSKKSITWNCPSCESIGSDIASLKTVIVSLQDEIKDLKTSIQVHSVSQESGIPDEYFEELLLEFEQRQERKYNLILHGLPEAPLDVSYGERSAHDCGTVNDMFQSTSPGLIPLEESSVKRLGKRSSNTSQNGKPRPIKIVMSNVGEVRKILKLSKTFKRDFNIFVSSDRTPRQRDHFNKIKAEFEQRKSSGENVQLKFIRGVPVIKSLNENPPIAM